MINLGIIGISNGNGHPYSWSAIINGYSNEYLDNCPYAVIRKYLRKSSFPENKIDDVRVTNIWTQDKEESKRIAEMSLITNVENNYHDLVGKVDGVLLARDDYESHYTISKPFIQAGVPIYIDKPIATSVTSLKKIFNQQKYKGQIFTCSALKYAKEFTLSNSEIESYGTIFKIIATAPKDWLHYSIHIIEPVLNIFNLYNDYKVIEVQGIRNGGQKMKVEWNKSLSVEFITTGLQDTPISIEIFGSNKNEKIIFTDTFYAFKAAIGDFIVGLKNKYELSKIKQLGYIVKIIEDGTIIK